jgi:hypothetical protein
VRRSHIDLDIEIYPPRRGESIFIFKSIGQWRSLYLCDFRSYSSGLENKRGVTSRSDEPNYSEGETLVVLREKRVRTTTAILLRYSEERDIDESGHRFSVPFSRWWVNAQHNNYPATKPF